MISAHRTHRQLIDVFSVNMYDTESRQAALAIEGVNGETEDIDIVELLLKTLGKGEILPYGIGNIVVIELAKFDVRHPDIGMPLCRMGQRQISGVILPNIVWSGMWNIRLLYPMRADMESPQHRLREELARLLQQKGICPHSSSEIPLC